MKESCYLKEIPQRVDIVLIYHSFIKTLSLARSRCSTASEKIDFLHFVKYEKRRILNSKMTLQGLYKNLLSSDPIRAFFQINFRQLKPH